MIHCITSSKTEPGINSLENINAESSNSTNTNNSSAQNLLRGALLTSTLVLGPHAACLLGLGGLTVGGVALTRWCGHNAGEADSSHGVELRRLPEVPTEYRQFPEERADEARAVLLAIEPKFQSIIDAKQKESPTEPIKVVFLEAGDNEHVSVVICKNGGLCPCSVPQVYELGQRADIGNPESYRGQHELLHVLYRE
jgi:hypothetical protein